MRQLVCSLLFIAVCAPAIAQVKVTRQQWDRFSALHMSNGTVEAIVVPELGRIVRYGPINAANLLWADPAIPESGGYKHWGGEKLWLWPQAQWGEPAKRSQWPPPGYMDPIAFKAGIDGSTIRMSSDVLPSYGVRLHREFVLDEQGTALTIRDRLEQVNPSRQEPFGLWSIAQIPVPQILLARLDAPAKGNGHAPMSSRPFASIRKLDPQTLLIERDPKHSTKIGFDGSRMGALFGSTFFVVELIPEGDAKQNPGEKGQIYANADPANAGALPAYIELEFTSPQLKGASRMQMRWTVHQLADNEPRTPEALAERLAKP